MGDSWNWGDAAGILILIGVYVLMSTGMLWWTYVRTH